MKNKFEIRTLGEVAELIATGKTPSTKNSEYFGGDVDWFTPGDIGGNIYLKYSTRTITDFAINKKAAPIFPKDCLLITCIGNIGRVGILSRDSSSNQQITAIKFKNFIDVRYAYFWFVASSHLLSQRANQAVVPILNNSQLREILFSFPPLPIQKQIAGILEKADAAREKRRQANKLTEQFLQSAFLEMFGDPVTNPKGWNITNVNDVASNIQYGYTESATIDNVGPKFLRITDIQNGIVDWDKVPYCKCQDLDKYKLESGDIVFARTGATTGKSFLIKNCPTAVFASYLIRVHFKKDVSPAYIYNFFQTESYWSQIRMGMTGSTQGGFNSSKLAEVKLPLPSISEQQKFATLVEKVELLRAKQRESEKELENLFNALMQRAFKGELVQ